MSTANHLPDPEDMFSDTRMSFGDHIEELRIHLLRAIVGFAVALVLSLFIGQHVVRFIKAPVEDQLIRYNIRTSGQRLKHLQDTIPGWKEQVRPLRATIKLDRNALREATGAPRQAEPVLTTTFYAFEHLLDRLELLTLVDQELLRDAHWVEVPMTITDPRFEERIIEIVLAHRRTQLAVHDVTEGFFTYFKVSMLSGFVLASPWIFWQVWSFIAAGLYPHEKRLVNVYMPFSIGLFLAGVALCQFFILPLAVEALLWFNEWLGLEPDLRLSQWLNFAILLPLVFGLSFQTPLVMLFFFTIGVFDIQTYREKRRIAWFVMALFAAFLTPMDVVSMLGLWVPMGFLYELGIILCQMQPKYEYDEEESDRDELIEV